MRGAAMRQGLDIRSGTRRWQGASFVVRHGSRLGVASLRAAPRPGHEISGLVPRTQRSAERCAA